ncbi:DUF2255 family protein [Sinomonas sp. JGH33]|uniref:DUF2255 family protein n=1 Tax=Sinomonas terricola TaxID=3110330 RepID=A0ABU5T9Z4_9MICC|nr:DUF2255 family protein [Sinomonas sp. JGH33]MEA5455931.1 DUF2255 family protein [Sinomonas sp. JGH33]
MAGWNPEELRRIVDADDLHIAPFREDGATPGTPTWIWCVAVDGELYVRGYNGTASRWYRAAATQGAGRIEAAGTAYDVAFEPLAGTAAEAMNAAVDAAYRTKYDGSPYLPPMVSARARAATVRIVPRA